MATVSYVLNGKGSVGEKTKQVVLQVASELGYPLTHTNTVPQIAVLYPDSLRTTEDSEIYSAFTQGIQSATGSGASVTFAPNNPQNFAFRVREKAGVDGYLMLGVDADHPIVQRAVKLGVPTVLLNHRGVPGVSSVCAANRKGMAELTRHLIHEHGVQRLLITQPIGAHSYSAERVEGVRIACRDEGLPDDAVQIVNYQQTVCEVVQSLDPSQWDAIVADRVTDAVSIVSELAKQGISVPDAIRVVGFDDHKAASQARPSITTARFDPVALGERATTALLSLIRGELSEIHLELPVEIVVRASCGCRTDP